MSTLHFSYDMRNLITHNPPLITSQRDTSVNNYLIEEYESEFVLTKFIRVSSKNLLTFFILYFTQNQPKLQV